MKVVRREGIPAAVKAIHDAARQQWQRFPALARYLEDHQPEAWFWARRCRRGQPKIYESRDRPGFYKVLPLGCMELPFCPACNKTQQNRRVRAALNSFHRCTPAGKQPRFVHIVQDAPLRNDGWGWGHEASRNNKAFAKMVLETLQEFYAPGIGAIMSYHDFGERAFLKCNPHLDLTLNGWMLQDDGPALMPTIDLTKAGRRKWDQALERRATRFRVDAEGGNVDFSFTITGNEAYYRVLAYQMRELVDVRKLNYSRERRVVEWLSYKPGAQRARFTPQQFQAGLTEYQARLGAWGTEPRQELHRAYGHISKPRIKETERLMGGRPLPHGKTCPCSECGDWDRLMPDEVDEVLTGSARSGAPEPPFPP